MNFITYTLTNQCIVVLGQKSKSWWGLFTWSLRMETHLGPDGTRLEQNAQARLKSLFKYAGQLVNGMLEGNRFKDMR